MHVVRSDVERAVGPTHLCAGQEAGCEVAVHAVRRLLSEENTDCALLVDASNAFNSLNRQAALRNVQQLFPSIGTALLNTYRGNAELSIDGETILSEEDTTQGDPLAMAFYALATVPLSKALRDGEGQHGQDVWFADDPTATGQRNTIFKWWKRLEEVRPCAIATTLMLPRPGW